MKISRKDVVRRLLWNTADSQSDSRIKGDEFNSCRRRCSAGESLKVLPLILGYLYPLAWQGQKRASFKYYDCVCSLDIPQALAFILHFKLAINSLGRKLL